MAYVVRLSPKEAEKAKKAKEKTQRNLSKITFTNKYPNGPKENNVKLLNPSKYPEPMKTKGKKKLGPIETHR
jgi:hypothetical protein